MPRTSGRALNIIGVFIGSYLRVAIRKERRLSAIVCRQIAADHPNNSNSRTSSLAVLIALIAASRNYEARALARFATRSRVAEACPLLGWDQREISRPINSDAHRNRRTSPQPCKIGRHRSVSRRQPLARFRCGEDLCSSSLSILSIEKRDRMERFVRAIASGGNTPLLLMKHRFISPREDRR